MNLILITSYEFKNGIVLNDFRVKHITEILNLKNNETFKFGIIEEESIYSCLYQKDIKLFFKESHKIANSNKLKQLKIIIGLMRPITAKRIMKDLTSIGVSEIIFFNSSLGEKSYSCSKLFKEKNYEKYLIEGAMQGGITYIPKVKILKSLTEALKNAEHESSETTKILLERKSKNNLVDLNITTKNATVIIGSERGLTKKEITLTQEHNFNPYNLSLNILRTETATVVASTIITSKMASK
ncbi:16S rRNA (uracil(1498)-N(3))-methyltransferase [Candidatus Borreliella tachyglossi]|uniref:Ribosomal RNA small subunit methyltransferase E n=1 Tax=Candidatus Borreliella tachyglossi TaxID=1964448 RepID=A0A2S1LVZ8_9SPIR|nr:16S rRNA (uracil(1498)-N(3))-methyltransferase [Candidatus Borreliella tachyglossi]AWG42461.1 16S rRNA (uracil(1498)-N(3))-methyltransferase [Candidatus Borreliella tachyglossi]